MGRPFQDALTWHMEQHGTRIAELSSATGVSQDVIKKLRRDGPYSTSVENGVAIAAYYGKTVEGFIARENPSDSSLMAALAVLLTPDERRFLVTQIRTLIASREGKAS